MALLTKVSGSFTRDKPTITETYLTSGYSVAREALAFIGGLQVVNGALVYVSPAIQSYSNLPCISADWDVDYTGPGNEQKSNVCNLVVTYGIPETAEGSELGSVSVEIGGDLLQLERGAFRWTSGPKSGKFLSDQDDVKPFLVVPTGTVKVKNNFVVNPNLGALTNFYGKVNGVALAFPGLTQTVPEGYCLFEGASVERKLSVNAYSYFEVTYNFNLAGHKWNEIFDGTGYSTVSPELYDVADLNLVFRL